MRNPARRSSICCLFALLLVILAALLAGCGFKGIGEVPVWPPLPLPILPTNPSTVQTIVTSTIPSAAQSTIESTDKQITQPTPTLTILGASYDFNLDLKAGPVELPLVIQIPSQKVAAPVLGVGLTTGNAMDAPKGSYLDPVWNSAFWYRGSAIPGEPGTATIAGHVNGLLGEPKIFAHLKKLRPGDLIIIHVNNTLTDIRFTVDEVKIYSIQESSDPAVLLRIFGTGSGSSLLPKTETDGLAHLTLITCTGYFKNGEFDHHVVVYATRSE